MKLIKKYQYSGPLNLVTIEDYLNYWRDNNVETDEALLQRLAEKYGPNHMQNWIDQRQYEINNPQSVHTGTGVITPTPKKSMSTKLADSFENMITSNTLEGGLARTIGAATLGAMALTNLPTVLGGIVGGELVNKAVGGFGEQVENLTGIDRRIGDFFNPGYFAGGYIGSRFNPIQEFTQNLFKPATSKAAIEVANDKYLPSKVDVESVAKDLQETLGEINSVEELINLFRNQSPTSRRQIARYLLNEHNFDIDEAIFNWNLYNSEIKPNRQWKEFFRMGIPIKKVGNDKDVQVFYSTIAKPALSKQTTPPKEMDALFNSFNIKEGYAGVGTQGLTLDGGLVRVLNGKDKQTLAHELHHALRNLLKNTLDPSGDYGYFTKEEQELLELFPYEDINEVAASLMESKFAIFMDLKKIFNRYPTLSEFEKYVDLLSPEELYRYFQKGTYSKYITKNLNNQLNQNIASSNLSEEAVRAQNYQQQANNLRNAFLKLGIGLGFVSTVTANQ